MQGFKRILMIMIATLLVASLSDHCSAAEAAFRTLGGLPGTPTEGARLVFTSNPSGRHNYLSIGATNDDFTANSPTHASSPKSLIAIDNGNLKISVPAITPEFQRSNARGGAGVLVKAELISIKF